MTDGNSKTTVLDGDVFIVGPSSGLSNGPAIATTAEEMQGYIYSLNARIIQQADDVTDDEITKALLFQRALNQHSLEKKTTRTAKAAAKKAPPKSDMKLEDL